jgi:hypothetical protein
MSLRIGNRIPPRQLIIPPQDPTTYGIDSAGPPVKSNSHEHAYLFYDFPS